MRQVITIIGAGLAGTLLAILLTRRGFQVEVIERRSDPEKLGYQGGRSINLALTERGLHALRQADLDKNIMDQAIMMRGRMIHEISAAPYLQRYGKDDSEVIWSVNRGRLNMSLLKAAQSLGVHVHFDQKLTRVDWASKRFSAENSAGKACDRNFNVLIGADGAGSALRNQMNNAKALGERFEPLGHGYKELEIPAHIGGQFQIEPNALHIWPRGGYMMIALPNVNGSFTVTLFLPNTGAMSFESLADEQTLQSFFNYDFPDAVTLLPDLAKDFFAHPIGLLGTLHLEHWHRGGEALLIGDAAHALVPFHGQGMNCAFEDCVELDALLGETGDFAALFGEFEARRKPNTEAIAEMALENYLEMRDVVADPRFQLIKQVERLLAERHPDRFVPRYTMVSFRRVPYAQAQARGKIQSNMLWTLTEGIKNADQVNLAVAAAMIQSQLSPLLA